MSFMGKLNIFNKVSAVLKFNLSFDLIHNTNFMKQLKRPPRSLIFNLKRGFF